jgi:hypothetical protein
LTRSPSVFLIQKTLTASYWQVMMRCIQWNNALVRVLQFVAILSLLQVGAHATQLKNANLTAEFGPNGLISIQQNTSNQRVDLNQDRWSLAIDQDRLSSSDASPQIEAVGTTGIDYHYQISGYEIKVMYRLMPGWQFVSKQIILAKSPHDVFQVKEVTPLDLELRQQVDSVYVPSSYMPQLGHSIEQSRQRMPATDFGAFLRLSKGAGVMLMAQNPFLNVTHAGNAAKLSYAPDMEWKHEWGTFEGDTACIGLYQQSGERLPREMLLEWKTATAPAAKDGMDRAEIALFTECVRAFLIHPQTEPSSVEVGWTLNDYQIDVGTEEGKAEYKRIIDSASALGVHHLLYAPGNSKLADRLQSADTWSWEYVLWLNMGQKIRKGEWDPAKDELPADVAEMVSYAKARHVGLLAYVYPSVPYEKDRSWLVHGRGGEANFLYATLASRQFQEYLLHNLIEFQKRTGITGYSFDYAFLNEPGSSSYAQWFGWRRVTEGLRRAVPEILIDGRQSYQQYGPWSWLAGTYPHPTGTDEQPESFKPYPDLHFDRVSADRTRFVNYWYRNYQFAPSEVIPGYATHQTERSINLPDSSADGGRPPEQTVYTRYRPRDWDYLGFRYSFLSSIATGGWNNVVDMIPARDEEERRHFSDADKRWIRDWLEWTITHKEYLRNTRTILDQPGLGNVDGTSAVSGDRGYLFLFNPNYQRKSASLKLDNAIGLTQGKEFIVREIYPQAGRLLGKPGAGVWSREDVLQLSLDGNSATVFEVIPATELKPLAIFNAATLNAKNNTPQAKLEGNHLAVTNAAGEPGESRELGVWLPQGKRITSITVNGRTLSFKQTGRYIQADIHYAGEPFHQAQQIPLQATENGKLQGSFIVPMRVHKQLAARRKAWPIPWTADDYETTWLAPERLLMFVQFAEGTDAIQPTAWLDGKPLALKPAYSSTRVHAASFVGYYADVSSVSPDQRHSLSLQISEEAGKKLQGAFFDNVEPQLTDKLAP